MGLDYLTVVGLISEHGKAGDRWDQDYSSAYRKLQRAWSKQAQMRGSKAKSFVYGVIGKTVHEAEFLRALTG